MLIIFRKYILVGLLNTLVHWVVFGLVYWAIMDQAISNLLGFICAVTLSFYINAKWTFNSKMTFGRYIVMVTFMGAVSWFAGKVADLNQSPPFVTLVMFSSLSLFLGFIFTKYFVFRGVK